MEYKNFNDMTVLILIDSKSKTKIVSFLTLCVRRAHRWDTSGSFSMRQAKIVVNLNYER